MFVTTLPPAHASAAGAYSAAAKRAGVDVLEIRGDLTPDVAPFDSALPLIAAPRGRGGAWVAALAPHYVDLELDEEIAIPPAATVIRSWHDDHATPSAGALARVAQRLRAAGADVIKIVTAVREPADLLTLESLRASLDQPATVLGTGAAAWPIRIRSPWRNPFTYVALPDEPPSAEGQLTIDAYPRGDAVPAMFGILGGPAMQSRSPALHTHLFRRHRVHAVYGAFPTDDAVAMLRALAPFEPAGFSVTAPHKTALLDVADELDPLARRVGAINTLVRRDGRWVGHQLDVHGIVAGYPALAGAVRAEILGTGGVVPAVIEACRTLGIESIAVRGRDTARVAELVRRFGVDGGGLNAASSEPAGVVFNAISADLDVALPPPARPGACAIDLRYGAPTNFLDRARAAGFDPHGGLAMLHHQACAQFELFTGVAVDVAELPDAPPDQAPASGVGSSQ